MEIWLEVAISAKLLFLEADSVGMIRKELVMYAYRPFLQSGYGALPDEYDISQYDYFSMITPQNRRGIVAQEAKWYRTLHHDYYAEGVVDTKYLQVTEKKVSVKLYNPVAVKNNTRPACIFIHGGAFMTCSIETHDFIPWYIAKHTGVRCISIDYRLIPENPFPAGLTDCKHVVRWVFDNCQSLHIDPSMIPVKPPD